jgi:hypothetical protein
LLINAGWDTLTASSKVGWLENAGSAHNVNPLFERRLDDIGAVGLMVRELFFSS